MNHDLSHATARLLGMALQVERGEVDTILAELPPELADEVKRIAVERVYEVVRP